MRRALFIYVHIVFRVYEYAFVMPCVVVDVYFSMNVCLHACTLICVGVWLCGCQSACLSGSLPDAWLKRYPARLLLFCTCLGFLTTVNLIMTLLLPPLFPLAKIVIGRSRMHSIALLLLEMIFVGAEARDPRQLKGLFPLPLTAVTGFLGACMAVRLLRDEGIELPHLW